jgi:hypothetical protein
MIVTGAVATDSCRGGGGGGDMTFNEDLRKVFTVRGDDNTTKMEEEERMNGTAGLLPLQANNGHVLIPLWLIVAGSAVVLVPLVYFIYDKYCKSVDGGPLVKRVANCVVIFYLLCGLVWSIVGFLWVFGAHANQVCGAESSTYQFAFFTLIVMNVIMDVWICFKMCVVLYWAFLSDD